MYILIRITLLRQFSQEHKTYHYFTGQKYIPILSLFFFFLVTWHYESPSVARTTQTSMVPKLFKPLSSIVQQSEYVCQSSFYLFTLLHCCSFFFFFFLLNVKCTYNSLSPFLISLPTLSLPLWLVFPLSLFLSSLPLTGFLSFKLFKTLKNKNDDL